MASQSVKYDHLRAQVQWAESWNTANLQWLLQDLTQVILVG